MRRIVVRDRDGMDAILGIHEGAELMDTIASEGILYRIIHVDDRRVHYEAQPAPPLPESWTPFVDPTVP